MPPGIGWRNSIGRISFSIRISASSICGCQMQSLCARPIRSNWINRASRSNQRRAAASHRRRVTRHDDRMGGGQYPMKKPRIAPRNGLLAGIDIGTSKICCFIAPIGDDGRPSVIGIGHHISRGLRGGAIVDMEQAEMAILTTVHAAEQMAGETIQDVVLNLSGGYPASQTIGVEVPISGREV